MEVSYLEAISNTSLWIAKIIAQTMQEQCSLSKEKKKEMKKREWTNISKLTEYNL